ncbi:MAG: STAS domain-containing protein [Olsenella sp.]|nr:STAS domain-containing protein [Olsenella sp.]
MELTILSTTNEGRRTLAVSGEVDVSNASELRDALDAAFADDLAEVEVDLADVAYIDSTGIGVLVGAAHHAQEAGVTLTVARPQRNVARVLGLLGVDAELNVRPSGAAEQADPTE